MVSSSPRIAVCICTYNRYDLLPKAIASARAQKLASADYEILVIDNSPDATRAEEFSARYAAEPRLRYVVERTPGLSNARNVAADLCRAPIIAFMDDDAVAAPEWLDEVLRAFDAFGPAATVVGGRVDPLWCAQRPPWLHDSLLGNLSVVDWGGDARIAAPSEWVAGTNVAFRVAAIRDHGGFDRNLGRVGSGAALLSNEEIQLVDRIRAAGGQLVYAPRAWVSHLVDPKRLTRSWFRKRATWQALSDFMMAPEAQAEQAKRRWPELLAYFNALPPHERTIRGLMFETDNPDLFRWQTGALYSMTMLMLAGFEGVALV